MKQTFRTMSINGVDALFTDGRIDRTKLPEGYRAYDIRHGDEGEPETIEPNVTVNHYGTILTKEAILMTKNNYTPIYEFGFFDEDEELEMKA